MFSELRRGLPQYLTPAGYLLLGAVIGTAMIALAGHDRAKPLPFGPYLALGGVIALFWGNVIVQTYLQP